MLTNRTIKSEFQLSTEGYKQDRDTYDSILKTLDSMLLHRTHSFSYIQNAPISIWYRKNIIFVNNWSFNKIEIHIIAFLKP